MQWVRLNKENIPSRVYIAFKNEELLATFSQEYVGHLFKDKSGLIQLASTVKAGFVSAVLSAGYHVELAGGGHYNAAALRSKVAEIQANIPEGVSITLNSLHTNPRQFGSQFPYGNRCAKKGYRSKGFALPRAQRRQQVENSLVMHFQKCRITKS